VRQVIVTAQLDWTRLLTRSDHRPARGSRNRTTNLKVWAHFTGRKLRSRALCTLVLI